ncbi:MAG: hypothetical protein G01um101472_108 [Parcubacteria group bacterium Gr01-1014_72]|nr:MAG: hypothetical protein G01um101472_108 [Parcubacteria group bacterium Gr01-1014_72]
MSELQKEDSGQNSYESKRALREAEEAARERRVATRKTARRLIWIGGVLVIVFGAVWLFRAGGSGEENAGPDMSRVVEIQSRDHISLGAEHPAYTTNPPTSGPHYGQTARRDFYTESVPDEYIIHNLEHGDIWISYHPRISDEAKEVLKKKFLLPKVIVTARSANDTDIALVSWGRIDSFNLEEEALPEGRIKDFIKRYRDKGPEQVPAAMDRNTFN